jgi:ATP-binding cassette, subfamily B, bacterial
MSSDLPKPKFNAQSFKSLLRFTEGHRWRYLLALLCLGASTLLAFGTPLIIGATIDGALRTDGSSGQNTRVLNWMGGAAYVRDHLWVPALAVAMATILAGGFGFLRGLFSSVACERIIRALRDRLYDQLQHLPPSWHDNHATGDLVQRCSSDVDTTRSFYQSQFVEIVESLVLMATVIPILVWLDWRMAIAATIVLPVIVGFSLFFFRLVQGSFKAMDEAEGAMSARMQENLTGIRVVRAFARRDFEIERFAEKNDDHLQKNYRLYKVMALFWASSDMLCFTQISIVTAYGAYRVSTGAITLGEYVTFLGMTGMYLWPVRHMGRILTELGKTLVALGRINEVLDAPREVDSPAPASLTERVQGRLDFEGVCFKHKDKLVLDNVSFSVEPGQTVALLGPSGAGKSTLMHLLLRFYDPASGTIRIDGVDITQARRKDVRRQIGVVMQEPFLYGKTVKDNIRLSRFEAENDEIESSAKVASVHESIQKFEKQYDTLVGERGVTLSGGQRQRVAIARALLKDAPILILDDALSAVDTHTEADIIGALKARRGQHTTILIAHRLSTLMHADRIFVLEAGRVTQHGTHAELVQQEGLYRGLWKIQSELEEDLQTELAVEIPRRVGFSPPRETETAKTVG